MHFKITSCFIFFCSLVSFCVGQQVIPLYTQPIPGAIKTTDEESWDANKTHVTKVSNPTLSVFLPSKEKGTGTAVIICPGGGYGTLVMKREGYDVAEYFVKLGVAAFVLKYRLPSEKFMKDKSVGPLQDAQQAIKILRERAAEWNIDPAKIGIMGFSAGGHLASTAGTHFNKSFIDNKNNTTLRPDFMILVYPVINLMDSFAHPGSKENLLGKSPSREKTELFSNDLQVTKQTPPAFLVHAGDDQRVNVSNSIRFYEALHKNIVAAELHIYSKGDHGFLTFPPFEEWIGRCRAWMQTSGFSIR